MFARTGFKTDGDCPPLRIGFETASTPTFIDVFDLCACLTPVQTPECSALDPQVRSAANFLRAFAATTLCLARGIVAHAAPATATAFLHDFEMDAGSQQERGRGMPRVVKADGRQTGGVEK
jgi:hypothetical protein